MRGKYNERGSKLEPQQFEAIRLPSKQEMDRRVKAVEKKAGGGGKHSPAAAGLRTVVSQQLASSNLAPGRSGGFARSRPSQSPQPCFFNLVACILHEAYERQGTRLRSELYQQEKTAKDILHTESELCEAAMLGKDMCCYPSQCQNNLEQP